MAVAGGDPDPRALGSTSSGAQMKDQFDRAAAAATHALGSPAALVGALVVIIVWALTGPLFGFSDTWQLVINTGTTIVTFLMVFVIQNAQNRDSKALHAKLDELIRSIETARNEFVDAENEPEEILDHQMAELRAWAAEASPGSRRELAQRLVDVPGIADVTVSDEDAPAAARDPAAMDRIPRRRRPHQRRSHPPEHHPRSNASSAAGNEPITTWPAAGSPTRMALMSSSRDAPAFRADAAWKAMPLSRPSAASTAR